MIRTYKSRRLSDAIVMASRELGEDERIESYNWQEGKSGCLRFFLIGPFAFFVRPKGELTVVIKE
jgi:hypothetical protein